MITITETGPAGWRESAGLYRWYVGVAEENGRKPAGRREFSIYLRRIGWRPGVRRVQERIVRSWFVTERWSRIAAEYVTVRDTGAPLPEVSDYLRGDALERWTTGRRYGIKG